jgi:hypothetical protein
MVFQELANNFFAHFEILFGRLDFEILFLHCISSTATSQSGLRNFFMYNISIKTVPKGCGTFDVGNSPSNTIATTLLVVNLLILYIGHFHFISRVTGPSIRSSDYPQQRRIFSRYF